MTIIITYVTLTDTVVAILESVQIVLVTPPSKTNTQNPLISFCTEDWLQGKPSLPLAKSTTTFWHLIFVYAWPEQAHWLTDRIYAFVIGQNSHCYVMSGIGGKEKCWPYNHSEKGHPVRAFNIITLSWLTKGIDTGVQLAESKCYQWSIREYRFGRLSK